MLVIRKNTANDFRVKLETQREKDNYIVEIVCSTILELIELEKIEPETSFKEREEYPFSFVEELYKEFNCIEIDFKKFNTFCIKQLEIVNKNITKLNNRRRAS